jgi:oxygen-independent coproporphyrinogen-3 oxidase
MKNPRSVTEIVGAEAVLSILMQTTGNSQSFSLYFHIPFCTRKCDYCHFFVLPDKEAFKIQYMESLEQEWCLRLSELTRKNLESIYFGGGTPALLGPERVHSILKWIKKAFPVSDSIEITLEANPENITLELMQAYKKAGINRVSIGIQTLYDPLLKTLGRTHSASKALEAVHATVQAGISNISIDLMYDLPDQKLSIWESTLQQAVKLPITHLSLYNLTIEPHTVFFKHKEDLAKRVPDTESSLAMYEIAVDILQAAGLKQYEISAFAKDNFYSRHNTGYWTGRPFMGFGPSAFSYWHGKRFKNVSHLNNYSRQLNEGKFPVDFEEELDLEAKSRELLAIQLRLLEGVDLANFTKLHQETLKALEKLEQQEFICRDKNRIKLTRRGILFYDTVATELI